MQIASNDPAKALSLQAVTLMVLFTYGLTAIAAYLLALPRDVYDWGDATSYSQICDAISHWDLHGLKEFHFFWGLPYFAAAMRALVPVDMNASQAIAVTSLIASFIAVFLAYQLWGAQVAAASALISVDWIQRSIVGGPEPLCMALVYGAFYLWRHGRWRTGALLAALAVTVRPLAIFALIAAGLVALKQRNYARFASLTLVSVGIGILYALPLLIEFGDPLLNFHNYQRDDWDSSLPLGVPLVSIVKGLYQNSAISMQFVYQCLWTLFLLLALACGATSRKVRQQAMQHPLEWLYALMLVFFLVSYNSSTWAWTILPRCLVMVLPFLLIATGQWWPRQRGLVWGGQVGIAMLAAASIANIDHSLHVMKSLLTIG